MLYIVLGLVLAAFGLLIAALTSANTLFAWLSVTVSVIAAGVLVLDWVRGRRARAAAEEPAREPVGAREEQPFADQRPPLTETVSSGSARADAGRTESRRTEPGGDDPAADDPSGDDLSRTHLLRDDLLQDDLPRDDLSRNDLSGDDLSRTDPSRDDLSPDDLSRTDLSRAGSSRADASADLSRAGSSGADTTSADLAGTGSSGAESARSERPGVGSSRGDAAETGPVGDDPVPTDLEPDDLSQDDPVQDNLVVDNISADDPPRDAGHGTGYGTRRRSRHEPEEVGEPGEEPTDAADLLIVADLRFEVRVVDEHPRYHLPTCTYLRDKPTIPLPVDEARQLGFTPCARCGPDAVLAAQHRAAR